MPSAGVTFLSGKVTKTICQLQTRSDIGKYSDTLINIILQTLLCPRTMQLTFMRIRFFSTHLMLGN